MIRLEANTTFRVRSRKNWVVLDVGGITYLLTPTEALELADMLVDQTERTRP